MNDRKCIYIYTCVCIYRIAHAEGFRSCGESLLRLTSGCGEILRAGDICRCVIYRTGLYGWGMAEEFDRLGDDVSVKGGNEVSKLRISGMKKKADLNSHARFSRYTWREKQLVLCISYTVSK